LEWMTEGGCRGTERERGFAGESKERRYGVEKWRGRGRHGKTGERGECVVDEWRGMGMQGEGEEKEVAEEE
jgi:hypothetical protein